MSPAPAVQRGARRPRGAPVQSGQQVMWTGVSYILYICCLHSKLENGIMILCMKLGVLLTFLFSSLLNVGWLLMRLFDPASYACVTGLFAFDLLLHRINRTGVRSVVSGLGAFSGAGVSWMRHLKKKKATFQRISVPKTLCISAAFESRDVLCLLRQCI